MRTGLPSEKRSFPLAVGFFLLGLIALAPSHSWSTAAPTTPPTTTPPALVQGAANASSNGAAQGTAAAGPSSQQATTAGQSQFAPTPGTTNFGPQAEQGPGGTWGPATPGIASCGTTNNPPGDCDAISIQAQCNGAKVAVTKANSNRLYPRGYGPKQTKLTTCMSILENAYMILSSLFSGPFDPLAIVVIILNVVVTIIVTQLLNLVCAMMLQLLNATQNFIKSGMEILMNLICIPLPKWTTNIFHITAPPGGHCGGNPFTNAPTGGLNVTIPGVQPYQFRQ
jgi:hypothetical protein